jgi:hypothetical protein
LPQTYKYVNNNFRYRKKNEKQSILKNKRDCSSGGAPVTATR